MEELPELTAGRTRGETRAGTLESGREEMYAFIVYNASSPGEIGFGFRSPIGLHLIRPRAFPTIRPIYRSPTFTNNG